MNAEAALRAIREAAGRVADKWQAIRSGNADAQWEDFSFYKGNARWSAGARYDLGELDASRFSTPEEACEAAARLVKERGWDGDYDPPDAARAEILAAIDAVRREAAASPLARAVSPLLPEPRADAALIPDPVEPPAAPRDLEPDEPAGQDPYRAAPRAAPPRYDGRPSFGGIFTCSSCAPCPWRRSSEPSPGSSGSRR